MQEFLLTNREFVTGPHIQTRLVHGGRVVVENRELWRTRTTMMKLLAWASF